MVITKGGLKAEKSPMEAVKNIGPVKATEDTELASEIL